MLPEWVATKLLDRLVAELGALLAAEAVTLETRIEAIDDELRRRTVVELQTGCDLFALGRHEAALEACIRAEKLDPLAPLPRLALAGLLAQLQHPQAAERKLQEAFARNPFLVAPDVLPAIEPASDSATAGPRRGWRIELTTTETTQTATAAGAILPVSFSAPLIVAELSTGARAGAADGPLIVACCGEPKARTSARGRHAPPEVESRSASLRALDAHGGAPLWVRGLARDARLLLVSPRLIGVEDPRGGRVTLRAPATGEDLASVSRTYWEALYRRPGATVAHDATTRSTCRLPTGEEVARRLDRALAPGYGERAVTHTRTAADPYGETAGAFVVSQRWRYVRRSGWLGDDVTLRAVGGSVVRRRVPRVS